ncbi:MAG: XrtA-associated tyrosine autokinase [Pseudomonadota bacterium]
MTVDDKGNERRPERTSLVERAAEKLAPPDEIDMSLDHGLDRPLAERQGDKLPLPDIPDPLAGDTELPLEAEVRPAAPIENGEVPKRPAPAGANGVHQIHENGVRSVELDFNRLESQGIVTPNNTRTRTTEEFRLIKRTVLANRWRDDVSNPNLIMVTSAIPGEGKTFSAMNLAMSIASEKDLSVLLIDCDLTKPTISSRFGISAQRGLVDVLEDFSLDIADVMIKTNVDGLTVIPAGAPNAMNPELLASDRMQALLSDMADRYSNRIIVFDSSPVLATTEPTVLAERVGQIIFVVEAHKTRSAAIKSAIELINIGPLIGMVLNKADGQFGTTQFGSYYYYYKQG